MLKIWFLTSFDFALIVVYGFSVGIFTSRSAFHPELFFIFLICRRLELRPLFGGRFFVFFISCFSGLKPPARAIREKERGGRGISIQDCSRANFVCVFSACGRSPQGFGLSCRGIVFALFVIIPFVKSPFCHPEQRRISCTWLRCFIRST